MIVVLNLFCAELQLTCGFHVVLVDSNRMVVCENMRFLLCVCFLLIMLL